MKKLKNFKKFEQLEYEEEQEEIQFSDEEIRMLEDAGLSPSGENRYCFPSDIMLIEVSKNEHPADGHIYYRAIVRGYTPGGGYIDLYKKRFKTLDYALRRLDQDMDDIIEAVFIAGRRLGAF